MSIAELQIVYDGPALETHEMEVRDLAPALLAIGDLFEAANNELNGSRAKIAVSVKGSFKTGCFAIDLQAVQSLASQVMDIFNSAPVTAALNIIGTLGFTLVGGKGVIQTIQWLRGRTITSISQTEDGKTRIGVDADFIDVEEAVLKLFRSVAVRQALEGAISKPLQREGINYFAVRENENDFVAISKEEAVFFIAPKDEQEEIISDEIREANLQLVNISFREDNKWRFFDGSATFYAEISDEDFLQRVDSSDETFSKGDILKVMLHEQSILSSGQLKRLHRIDKVLEHRRSARQLKLPMPKADL